VRPILCGIANGFAGVFAVAAVIQRYSGDHDLAAYLIGWACILLLVELRFSRVQQ
jgi:hypothetical protein